MNTPQPTPRKIELDRHGEVVTVASVRLPAELWQRFKDLCESEHRTASQELRRHIEARLAEAERVEAAA